MDTKTRPIYICCLEETHFRPKDTYKLKMRGLKNIFHANGKQKKAGIPILISDKIDLKIRLQEIRKDTTSIEEDDISRHPTQEHLNI